MNARSESEGLPAALSRAQIRELLDEHALAPSRALGQNFLCDPSMVDKIVRLAEVGPDDQVIEIGPGLGSLTLGLCGSGASVVAVEIDQYLIPALRQVAGGYEDRGTLRIVNADVRAVDWANVLAGRPAAVVANLPYNIATPLILDLLAAEPLLERWVVMVQREAGERLVAEPGSKIYGIPSVLLGYWATARIVGSVPPELFLPKPNVDSVLVRIDRRSEPRPESLAGADFARVSHLVKTGFGQRRKMLRRSLANVVDSEALDRAAIDPTERPEQLAVEDWVRLAKVAP